MRVGTPGFIGSNLTEAREARCLHITNLASIVGVSKQSISQFESGKVTPSPETLRRISDRLNFPEEFFFRKFEPNTDLCAYFRSLRSDTAMSRKRALHRMRWTQRIFGCLADRVEFPDLDIPNWVIRDYRHLSDEDIENYASDLRDYWKLGAGPIGNVVWLLESKGFVIARSDLEDPRQDALSAWSSQHGRPFILLGTQKESSVRSRFDACHELAHMLLHRSVDPASLKRNSPEYKLMENQAHRFSSAFLFPRASFVAEVFIVRLESLQAIKCKWKTSIAMMVKRSHDLDLISDEQSARLWRSLARRGWRTIEPFDDTIEIEEPCLIAKAIEALLDGGYSSKAEIRSALALSETDIEDLCGLSPGMIGDSAPSVTVIEINELKRA